MLRRVKNLLRGRPSNGGESGSDGKNWGASQEYEMDHAREFMDTEFFRKLHSDVVSGKRRVSDGYQDETLLREFFGNSTQD